jgi:glycosyltransferase involved in cell wall biosynthesis
MAAGGIPADRIHMIPNFVKQPEMMSLEMKMQLREEYGIAKDDLLVCSVGRFHPVKGMDSLLQAFALLRQNYSQRSCRLMLVGAGPQMEQLKQQAESLGISNDIIWAGWKVSPSPFYQIADVFVCASRQEGFGNVILEAWANGVAVVSTATIGPLEIIDHGKTGLITPIDDSGAMADALYTLADDCELRSEMCDQANRQLVRRYSEATIIGQYRDLYDSIIR